MEGDTFWSDTWDTIKEFQSTPSVWRETRRARCSAIHVSFQSTPSVWRETLFASGFECYLDISIHSLRMEGDQVNPHCGGRNFQYFNPLPPYGGRLCIFHLSAQFILFQSTPSVWRETNHFALNSSTVLFQSTPSVWRETLRT